MTRTEKALQNHKAGYNCAQAVLCAFADITPFSEDDLFKMAEGFGFGMGCRSVCGAVSAMTALAGILNSGGIGQLPLSNKKQSYLMSRDMSETFAEKNGSVICGEIKDRNLRSCDGCIADAVAILEEKIGR